jgi:hypothetical protein
MLETEVRNGSQQLWLEEEVSTTVRQQSVYDLSASTHLKPVEWIPT